MSTEGAVSPILTGDPAFELAVRRIIPRGMACCIDDLDALQSPLHTAELLGTERMAPVRLREFIAGRTAARRALLALTGTSAPIPRGSDRAPIWPEGLRGSLSHSRHYAVCVLTQDVRFRAVGVDIEEDSRLEEKIWGPVLSAREQEFLRRQPAASMLRLATLLFSAKESYYKCLNSDPATRSLIPEPDTIEVTLNEGNAFYQCSVPSASGLPVLSGNYVHIHSHWLTLCHAPCVHVTEK